MTEKVKPWWKAIKVKKYQDNSVGSYVCWCAECGLYFLGHKRDQLCNKCEAARLSAQVENSLGENI